MEIDDLTARRLGESNTLRTYRTHRNFCGGLTKDPVQLGVVRDVSDAHEKQRVFDRVEKRRSVWYFKRKGEDDDVFRQLLCKFSRLLRHVDTLLSQCNHLQ